MTRLYQFLLLLFSPFLIFWIAVRWRARFFSRGFEHARERRGDYSRRPRSEGKWNWIHLSSVGEAKTILPLLRGLKAAFPAEKWWVSTMTEEGRDVILTSRLADQTTIAPMDLSWMVRRAFDHIQPARFLLMESEFWPNLLVEAERRGIPIGYLNGRLSPRNAHRIRMLRAWVRPVWKKVGFVLAREQADADQFVSVGVAENRVVVVGNLKYDLEPLSGALQEQVERLKTLFAGRPVYVSGSTHPGEDAALRAAFEMIRAALPNVLWISAPRHVERVKHLKKLLGADGQALLKSELLNEASHFQLPASISVILWDTLGDLQAAYAAADCVFVGGSLIDHGGQNPLEPAFSGKPVLFGPSMENFVEIVRDLLRSEGGFQVSSAQELAGRVQELLLDPDRAAVLGENARACVERHRGAAERTITFLKSHAAR